MKLKEEFVDLPWLLPISLPVRIAIILIGIALPIACLFLTISYPPFGPLWQSGALGDKLAFVLTLPCGWPMQPLLAFAMTCLGFVIFNEDWAASKWWVRFGLYTGVPVTTWYALIFGWTVGPGNGAGVAFVGMLGIVLLMLIYGVYRGIRLIHETVEFGIVWLAGSVVALLLGIGVLASVAGAGDIIFVFFISLLVPAYCATSWAFIVYLGMSLRIFFVYRRQRFGLAEMMGWMAWISAFVAAIRWSVILSMHEYSKLPLEEPDNCYVATAAAKGYPKIVKSIPLVLSDENVFIINQQLSTFKAAELAMRVVSPSAHRIVRIVYDRVGPNRRAPVANAVAGDRCLPDTKAR